MPAVGPAQIIGPLEPVFDVEIRIAAAPAAESRRAGYSSRVNKRDAGKPGKGEGRVAMLFAAANRGRLPYYRMNCRCGV